VTKKKEGCKLSKGFFWREKKHFESPYLEGEKKVELAIFRSLVLVCCQYIKRV
jgi:hypothetical protein